MIVELGFLLVLLANSLNSPPESCPLLAVFVPVVNLVALLGVALLRDLLLPTGVALGTHFPMFGFHIIPFGALPLGLGVLPTILKVILIYMSKKMPKCENCKKKCGIPMTCTCCDAKVCYKCLNLTVHKCPKMDEKSKQHLADLEKKLAYSVKKQDGMLCS